MPDMELSGLDHGVWVVGATVTSGTILVFTSIYIFVSNMPFLCEQKYWNGPFLKLLLLLLPFRCSLFGFAAADYPILIFDLAQVFCRMLSLVQSSHFYPGLGSALSVNPSVAGLVSCLGVGRRAQDPAFGPLWNLKLK